MTWLNNAGPNQNRTHIARDHARAGTTPHVVRNVLAFSIALALIALAVAFIFGKPPARDAVGSASGSTVAGGQAQ
ncbi:hypothetical protein [Novosphingobium sp. 9]|uniref:hypothetical protein n=1 Tax=Novosphingobium sp. 9 TaxID=2025349 RepID=UPI0021B6B2D7|nr:hypothetical protein [Novosphingobium sp. 9]